MAATKHSAMTTAKTFFQGYINNNNNNSNESDDNDNNKNSDNQ